MNQDTYCLKITGNILPDIHKQTALEKFSQLTKISIEKANRLLDSQPHIIKKQLSLTQAQHYQVTLENIGIICLIEKESPVLTLVDIETPTEDISTPPLSQLHTDINKTTYTSSTKEYKAYKSRTVKEDLALSFHEFKNIFSCLPMVLWNKFMLLILAIGVIVILLSGGSLLPKPYELLYDANIILNKCDDIGCRVVYELTLGNTGRENLEHVYLTLPTRFILEHAYFNPKTEMSFSTILVDQEKNNISGKVFEKTRYEKNITNQEIIAIKKQIEQEVYKTRPTHQEYDFGPIKASRNERVLLDLFFQPTEKKANWEDLLLTTRIEQGIAKPGNPYGNLLGRILAAIGFF